MLVQHRQMRVAKECKKLGLWWVGFSDSRMVKRWRSGLGVGGQFREPADSWRREASVKRPVYVSCEHVLLRNVLAGAHI
jgi:hypothetical protein